MNDKQLLGILYAACPTVFEAALGKGTAASLMSDVNFQLAVTDYGGPKLYPPTNKQQINMAAKLLTEVDHDHIPFKVRERCWRLAAEGVGLESEGT